MEYLTKLEYWSMLVYINKDFDTEFNYLQT